MLAARTVKDIGQDKGGDSGNCLIKKGVPLVIYGHTLMNINLYP
jgi:hypothetical protein